MFYRYFLFLLFSEILAEFLWYGVNISSPLKLGFQFQLADMPSCAPGPTGTRQSSSVGTEQTHFDPIISINFPIIWIIADFWAAARWMLSLL